MGYRLSKIYTRTGDDGTTGLGDGRRVAKQSPRVVAMGDIDELNSCLGLLLCEELPEDCRAMLTEIQHRLFDLGGEISLPGYTLVQADKVAWLEAQLDRLNADLAPLEDFILPGGTRAAATCHVARAVCRRAERSASAARQSENVSVVAVAYLNRLSDLLFVLARYLNRTAGAADVLWQRPGAR